VAAKNPDGLGNANATPKPSGVLKRSEAAEERSGWNCWLTPIKYTWGNG